jgi:carboxymethylenebutenolidase
MGSDRLDTQDSGNSRRQFLMTNLAAGFALAVQPVTAETITTDTTGLFAGQTRIPTSDVEIPAYQAMPNTGGPFPVVLVVEEIFGVHEHIKDICRRFAKLGYLAIAPELFARQGDVSAIPNFQDIVTKVVSKVPDAQVMSDLDATVAFADKSGKGDISRLGITGFCWGGRIVWLYSAHQPKLKAGAAWYGRLVPPATQPNPLQPRQPIELVNELHGAVIGFYGGKDQGIPVSSVDEMRAALKKAGKEQDFQLIVYPDAGHGFNADYRPSYKEDDAKDAWAKLLSCFKAHGAA